jgi:hypothetical protein
MAKTTRALSGAAKDAFFDRVVEREHLDAHVSSRLVGRLKGSVSQVRVRTGDEAMQAPELIAAVVAVHDDEPPFDPFTPNVIVVLRTQGREAALAELGKVRGIENLRLLAREQQLSIGSELATELEVREAIVHAGERRIANRRAAATA